MGIISSGQHGDLREFVQSSIQLSFPFSDLWLGGGLWVLFGYFFKQSLYSRTLHFADKPAPQKSRNACKWPNVLLF